MQHLVEGQLVLIDTGCTVQGYHSDITRTWIYGKPSDHQRRIWDLEQAAQAAAFAVVRPGVACEVVDRAARQVLELGGLGPDYRLGLAAPCGPWVWSCDSRAAVFGAW